MRPDLHEISVWSRRFDDEPAPSRNLVGHVGWIGALAFSPTGELLASGARDGTVRLWDPYQGQLLAELRDHRGAVYSMQFSPRGDILASAGVDGAIRFWTITEVLAEPSSLFRPRRSSHVVLLVEAAVEAKVRADGDAFLQAVLDLTDHLMQLDSPKAIDDAVAEILRSKPFGIVSLSEAATSLAGGPAGPSPSVFHVLNAVIWTLQVRLEQAYREGDGALAAVCNQLGVRISRAVIRDSQLPHWGEGLTVSEPSSGAHKLTSAGLPLLPTPVQKSVTGATPSELIQILADTMSGTISAREARDRAQSLDWKADDLMVALWSTLNPASPQGGQDLRSQTAAARVGYEMARRLSDPTVLSMASHFLGSLLAQTGETAAGIELLESAVHVAPSDTDPLTRGAILNDLGNAYRNCGHLNAAERALGEAAQFARSWKDSPFGRQLLGMTLNNIAVVYGDISNWAAQRRTLEEAECLARELRDEQMRGGVLSNLGNLSRDTNDPRGALSYYLEAVACLERGQDPRALASALGNCGLCRLDLGEDEAARADLERSRALARDADHPSVEANSMVALARLWTRSSDFAEAKRLLDGAIEVVGRESHPQVLFTVQRALAELYEASGEKPDRTLKAFREAAATGERLRRELRNSGEGAGIHSRLSRVYGRMVQLASAEHRHEEAFDFAERSRASLLIRDWAGARRAGTHLPSNRHLPLAAVRRHLESLGQNAVLVAYFMANEVVYIFILRARDGRLNVETQPLTRSRLERTISAFEREVARHLQYGDIGETWLEIGDALIDPILPHLDDEALIIFVPHGRLFELPLHALQAGERRVLERWPVVYVPAASAIPALIDAEVGPPTSALTVGVHFVDEARAVALILEADQRQIGEHLEKQALLGAMMEADLIHVSAHGFYFAKDPERSGWLLRSSPQLERYVSALEKPGYALDWFDLITLKKGDELQDAIMTAADIEQLGRLSARLVTLSSCESGLLRANAEQDPAGLVRAFLRAGVPGVIGAAWRVDPQPTRHLMESFYGYLRSDGVGWTRRPQALQLAALEVMRDFPHTYYWAAFALIGGFVPRMAGSQEVLQ